MHSFRSSYSTSGAGFTLIELVMVIVILGVLAAVGLPKFVDLKKDARTATISAARGSVASAAAMVRAKVMTTGTATDATVRQVDIGGGDLIDVKYGYPACTANGIAKASGTGPNSASYIWYIGGSDLCTLYPNLGRDAAGDTVYLSNCAMVYDSRTGGTWTPVTSGC